MSLPDLFHNDDPDIFGSVMLKESISDSLLLHEQAKTTTPSTRSPKPVTSPGVNSVPGDANTEEEDISAAIYDLWKNVPTSSAGGSNDSLFVSLTLSNLF